MLLTAVNLLTLFSVLMADPNWNKGFYYDGLPPHTGMKLARREHHFRYKYLYAQARFFRNRYDYVPFGA